MNELLHSAKAGNDEALSQLFYRYRPLVYSIKNKYFLRDFDDQDWVQEGFICFHDCIQAFEEALGITLGAFFKRSFENRVRSLVRKECAFKRKSNHYAVSFEQEILQEGLEIVDQRSYSENPLHQVIIQETMLECQYLLSDLERHAFFTYAIHPELSIKDADKPTRSAFDRSKRKISTYLKEKGRSS